MRPAGADRDVPGTLAFVDNAVDPTTGTILLKARVENEDEALWPGQVVDVFLRIGERSRAVVVPASAVASGQQGDYAYVVSDERKAQLRPVVVAQAGDEEAVISQGIAAGELVVTEGQLKLRPDAPVELLDERGKAQAGGGEAAAKGGTDEPLRAVHPPARHDDARHGELHGVRRLRLPGACRSPTCRWWTSRPSQVNASLPGASPETMASSVATPLERQFSNIAGVKSMNSSSSQGSTSITLEFDLDRDIDSAALDVQSAISVEPGGQLPSTMPNPPTFRKVNPADQPILYLSLTSPTLPLSERQPLRGGPRGAAHRDRARASRRWRSSARRSTRCASSSTRARSLRGASASRRWRRRSATPTRTCPPASWRGATAPTPSRRPAGSSRAASFRDVVVAFRDGAPVRLADLGEVKDGVEDDRVAAWFAQGGKDQRSVTVAVRRQPGTNTVEIARQVQGAAPHRATSSSPPRSS